MGIVQMTDQNEQMDVCGQIPHFSNLSLQPIPKTSPLKLERKYAIQLTQLQKKGFKNKKRCLRLLDQFHGNVHQAELILSQSNPRVQMHLKELYVNNTLKNYNDCNYLGSNN